MHGDNSVFRYCKSPQLAVQLRSPHGPGHHSLVALHAAIAVVSRLLKPQP